MEAVRERSFPRVWGAIGAACALCVVVAWSCNGSVSEPDRGSFLALYVPQMVVPKVQMPNVHQALPQMAIPMMPEDTSEMSQVAEAPSYMVPSDNLDQTQSERPQLFVQPTAEGPSLLTFLGGFAGGLAAGGVLVFSLIRRAGPKLSVQTKNFGDSLNGSARGLRPAEGGLQLMPPGRAGEPTMVAAGAGALHVGASKMHSVARASRIVATIANQLAAIEGPDLYWEEKGPLENPPKEESDFKEYDSFSTFLAACAEHGVDLRQPDITVFAPGNKACAEYSSVNGPLSKDVCLYHVVKGVVNSDSLSSADLTTLQGSKITYRRMFRKHFVDNAFCAAMASPPRTSYRGDIQAANGLIHMINEVLYPGWSESAGMEATR